MSGRMLDADVEGLGDAEICRVADDHQVLDRILRIAVAGPGVVDQHDERDLTADKEQVGQQCRVGGKRRDDGGNLRVHRIKGSHVLYS